MAAGPNCWPASQVTPTVANPVAVSGALSTRICCGPEPWVRDSEIRSRPAVEPAPRGTVRTLARTGADETSDPSGATPRPACTSRPGATISSWTTPTADSPTVA